MASSLLPQLATLGPDADAPAFTLAEAEAYTRRLQREHSENFTVISLLLPRELRQDFANVYAFCRWADDLGDEACDPAEATRLLAWWRDELDRCYADHPRHPVFVALRQTIGKHDLPREPFDRLIDAFLQDQTVTRYETWDQLLDYCTRSADPVGRLVLLMCGHRDPDFAALSDATCTALQLTNFWQDVRRDVLERDRVYLPAELLTPHGLTHRRLVEVIHLDEQRKREQACGSCVHVGDLGIATLLPAYRSAVREAVGRTWPLFERGRALLPLVHRRVRADLQLFTLGGEAVLRKIERRDFDTLTTRPRLGKAKKASLLLRAMAGRLVGPFGR